MDKCEICGKPTTSHVVGEYFVSHTCWTGSPEEVDELRERTKKEEKEEKGETKEKTVEEIKDGLRELFRKRKKEEEEAAKKFGGKKTAERLSNNLEDVSSNEELYAVFEEYQREMKHSLKWSPKGHLFRYIERKVSKKISDLLFEFTQKEGWSFVLEFIKKYGPDNEEVIDSVPVEDVVSRMIILTRAEEGVENIPIEALEYLTEFYDAPDLEWETSFSCGWGFDHPHFDFEGLIEKMVEMNKSIWASAILQRAFYADQEKAAPMLIEFLRKDDISNKNKLALTHSIAFFIDDRWGRMETSPRYWNWKEAIGRETFEWDEEVERSLKEAIEEELAEHIEREQSKEMEMFERAQKNLPVKDIDFSKEWSFIDLQI